MNCKTKCTAQQVTNEATVPGAYFELPIPNIVRINIFNFFNHILSSETITSAAIAFS